MFYQLRITMTRDWKVSVSVDMGTEYSADTEAIRKDTYFDQILEQSSSFGIVTCMFRSRSNDWFRWITNNDHR
jgi:hypothetical protein